MKKIIICLFILSSVFSINAQTPTVTIGCVGGGTACFMVNSDVIIDYGAITANVPSGYSASFVWKAEPATAFNTENPNLDVYGVNWMNKPNNPARKVKVKATFTKANSTTYTDSTEKIVVVKHIAPITSMTISGATPGTLSNSGLSTELPCGTQPITISVPTPITDPVQPVTYIWTLPNGWSGSSTTNSINVSPTAGDNGNLSVVAKRTDGNVVQSFYVSISRASAQSSATPNIETLYSSDINKVLCAGESRLFGANNINNIYNFEWSSSPANVVTFSSPHTMGTFVDGIANSSGGTTLIFTTQSACGFKTSTWDLAVDKPKVDYMTVDGTSYAPLISQSYGCNGALAVIDIAYTANQTGQNYSWQLNGGNGSYYTYNNGTQAVLYAYNDAAFKVIANNRCGNGSQAYFIRYNTCDGYYRMASPNPTQNTVSVQMDQALGRDALVSIRFISDARSSVVRSFTSDDARRTNHFDKSDHVDFDVSNLPRGTYYLIVEFKEGKSFKETIILN